MGIPPPLPLLLRKIFKAWDLALYLQSAYLTWRRAGDEVGLLPRVAFVKFSGMDLEGDAPAVAASVAEALEAGLAGVAGVHSTGHGDHSMPRGSGLGRDPIKW